MATLGMPIDFREDLPLRLPHREGMPRAHHDAVDAIQSPAKEENIDCGFARTGKLNLAP
jgi:hypothetical protein